MKQLTYTIALAFVLIVSTTVVSAGLFDWFKDAKEVSEPQIPSYIKMGLNETTFNTFTTQKTELETKQICENPSEINLLSYKQPTKCKIYEVTDKLSKETTYTEKDISNLNYFYENDEGIVRFKNE